MDERYRVEVLHIVNPHVIFLESQTQSGLPVIEQVGFYGLLPVNKTVDIDGQLVAERCENWPMAANTELRELLAEYKNCTYFIPIQTYERSTIFDQNIHQFGDIVILSGEKRISLTNQLIKSLIAVKDDNEFHERLSSGRLKIKLNSLRTEEVLNEIKKYYKKQKRVEHDWQKTINKQTSLYQESKRINADLTEKNLRLHTMANVMEAIERKEKDLDLCKGADMVSIGRGSRRNRSKNGNSDKDENNHSVVLKDIKKFLEVNGQTGESNDNFNHKSNNSLNESVPLNYNEEKTYEMPDKIQEKFEEYEDGLAPLKKYNKNEYHETPHQDYFKTNLDEEINTKNAYLDTKHGLISRRKDLHNKHKHKTDTNKNSDKGPISSSLHEHKTSSEKLPKKVTAASKPKERLLVFCPDMEMSTNNIKNFIPTKVVDEFLSGYSKYDRQVKDSSANIVKSDFNNVDHVNSNFKIEINDSPEKTNRITNKYDESQTESRKHSSKYINLNKTHPQNHSKTQYVTVHDTAQTIPKQNHGLVSSILRRKLHDLKESQKREMNNSLSSNSDTSVKDTSSSTENSKVNVELRKTKLDKTDLKVHQKELNEKLTIKTEQIKIDSEHLKINKNLSEAESQIQHKVPVTISQNVFKVERNVNPFKNLDGSKSVFVEKLITPILMVHTKNDNLILPQCDLRDIPFNTDIHCMLRNMKIQMPKRLQSVSWNYILRGHSVFMISPAGNGKTLGYVPAVCNLVTDSIKDIDGVGPLCIIVCGTSLSVSEIETYCKRFMDTEEQIIACYHGLDISKLLTSLLNGCHILICTAPMLVSLLEIDFGVDLRHLMTLVLEDCERLSQVYSSEVATILQHVKNMLKNRSDKSLKVQYVVASRQWYDFMTPLAKYAPDTVVAIGASQESVLYSKTRTSVNFVKNQENKINAVAEFLKEIDDSKRTVIVCRADDEVDLLEKTLKIFKHKVFACNSNMTLHDLYSLSEAWGDYQEPILGPVLICCDGNLTHLNITNANYLVHFSMPPLFSMFCKRFSVLNENFASIFSSDNENTKIKILLDETNVEQLPKILHFVKRCTNQDFPMLENILLKVEEEKDLKKAENLTPICNNLLTLGECTDLSNCLDRHTGFNDFDNPKDWMPKQGTVNFKIIHHDTAVSYSARLLENKTISGTYKYPNNYKTLPLKMGRYYSKEINRKMHGVPKVGDICAVAVRQSFFERCKVLKVIPIDNRSCHVLINLTDEEHLTVVRDIQLYYLPDDLKAVETHVVKVRLANLKPKDNDVTFSIAAKNRIHKMTECDREQNLYIRGRIMMTLSNCIFVETAEACVDLSSLGETVVKCDLKKELLERHAEPNPHHIAKLRKLGGAVATIEAIETIRASKVEKSPMWAHLDKGELSTVFLANVIDVDTVFVRHSKFDKVINLLQKDIQEYVVKAPELTRDELYVGNFVLAEIPDDQTYERARIDEIVDNTVKCFLVDNGDWRHIKVDKLKPITESILHRLPCQAIECRLVGIKPPGDASDWPEFSTFWLDDNYCFEDNEGNLKCLFVKYFTKDKSILTGGHKYGVVLIDTSSDKDVIINNMMIELNLAKENVEETIYINEPLDAKPVEDPEIISLEKDDDDEDIGTEKLTSNIKDLVPCYSNDIYTNEKSNNISSNILFEKPIRSVPLIEDSDSDISDKWDVVVDKNLLGLFGQASKSNVTEYISDKEITDEGKNTLIEKSITTSKRENDNVLSDGDTVNNITIRAGSSNTADSSISIIEISKEMTKSMLDSSMSETQSDSNDIDISNDKMKALNILKNKLTQNDITDRFLKKADLVKITNISNNDKSILKSVANVNDSKEIKINESLDSDDLSSIASELKNNIKAVESPRTPRLIWRQNNNAVTLKINLIGVEDYDLDITERSLKFSTWHNDTFYEFEIILYGVIKPNQSMHSNKGQYIQVKLTKMLRRNWLYLTKDLSNKKWIVYDVDAIELSSDNDEKDEDALRTIKHIHEQVDSASEDEDCADDLNFIYKKHLDE